MTGYDGYILYQALKLHFSPGTYDFFRYHGKVNVSVEAFERRNDRYFFHKLVRKYKEQDALTFFLAANFFSNKVVWVRDLLQEEAHQIYLQRKKIKESLAYTVTQDLDVLAGKSTDFRVLLRVPPGEYPPLLTAAVQGDIQKETVIVLDSVIGFMPMWSLKIADTILFPEFKHKLIRYAPFLQVDVKYFAKTLRLSLDKPTT